MHIYIYIFFQSDGIHNHCRSECTGRTSTTIVNNTWNDIHDSQLYVIASIYIYIYTHIDLSFLEPKLSTMTIARDKLVVLVQ